MKQQDILRQRILRALLSSPRLTRAELLERIPVRPATLYDAIRRLDREGLVDEPERSGVKTGRKASPIMLHPKAGRFVGVELDVADTLAVLIDASGEVLAETRVHSKSPKDVEAGKREIRATLTDLRKKAKASDWRGLKGVGFADPGLVDVKRGISLRAVNIPGWECFPTRDWLQKETGLP
ncbi:ROK family transcriptional regulator, partial [bacterium]|nr:ROK family transcriptional regulator [bacterium]